MRQTREKVQATPGAGADIDAQTILADRRHDLAPAKFKELTTFPVDDPLVAWAVAAYWIVTDGFKQANRLRAWREKLNRALTVPTVPSESPSSAFLNAEAEKLQGIATDALAAFDRAYPPFWARAFAGSGSWKGRKKDVAARAFAFTLVWLWEGSGRGDLTATPAALAFLAWHCETQGKRKTIDRRMEEYVAEAKLTIASGAWIEPSPVSITVLLLINGFGEGDPSAAAVALRVILVGIVEDALRHAGATETTRDSAQRAHLLLPLWPTPPNAIHRE